MDKILFKARHISTNNEYWFDLTWGNMISSGSGYIGMLPMGVEREMIGNFKDNRVPIDPNECEITRYIDYKKEKSEFENAVRPLMKYLGDKCPHTSVIVTNTEAEMLSGEIIFNTDEYLVD